MENNRKEYDPYTFDYKKYIKEIYHLDESPASYSKIEYKFEDPILNNKEGIDIEKNSKFIEIFLAGNTPMRLFMDNEGNDITTYYLMEKDRPFISAMYSFRRITEPINGIENQSAWNHKWSRGLFRYFFENYIILKENVIISDRLLTEKGFKLWKSLYEDLVETEKRCKMFILDFNNGKIIKQIDKEDEMDYYYGENKFNQRFMLKKI